MELLPTTGAVKSRRSAHAPVFMRFGRKIRRKTSFSEDAVADNLGNLERCLPPRTEQLGRKRRISQKKQSSWDRYYITRTRHRCYSETEVDMINIQ